MWNRERICHRESEDADTKVRKGDTVHKRILTVRCTSMLCSEKHDKNRFSSVRRQATPPLRLPQLEPMAIRLAFTERCDSGYRFPIGIPIYRFRTEISVF